MDKISYEEKIRNVIDHYSKMLEAQKNYYEHEIETIMRQVKGNNLSALPKCERTTLNDQR